MAQITVSHTDGLLTCINFWTLPSRKNQLQWLAQMKTEVVAMSRLPSFVSRVLLPSFT